MALLLATEDRWPPEIRSDQMKGPITMNHEEVTPSELSSVVQNAPNIVAVVPPRVIALFPSLMAEEEPLDGAA